MKTALYLVALLAVYAIAQRQDAADAEYTRNLEQVVAKCLSNPVGQPIAIGEEIYLCSIYNTGEKMASY